MIETEWLEGRSVDEETPRLTVLPWLLWVLVIVIAISAALHSGHVIAAPLFSTKAEGVVIVLFDDPCALKGDVTNLPGRATWLENGKEVEGCWGYRPDMGIVQFYWADKTVMPVPSSAFQRVTGV